MPRHTFLEQYGAEEISHMSKETLEGVWRHYDENQDGELNESELAHLTTAVVIRVEARLRAMFLEFLQQEDKEDKPKEVLERELNEHLGEMFNNGVVERAKTDLLSTLEAKDGKVTKDEFFRKWNTFANRFVEVEEFREMCCLQ